MEEVYFIFLKKLMHQTWKSFDTEFEPQCKDRRSYQVRQNLAFFSHTSYSNFRLKLFFKGFNCNVFLCFKTPGAIWKQKTVSRDKTVDKTFGQTLVFVWNSTLRENLISIFQQLFTSNNKIFILGERIATRLWFYEVLRFSWWFLIS